MTEFILLNTITLAAAAVEPSVMDMVLESGYIIKAVLLTLFAFSIISWGIIYHKFTLYNRIRKETDSFKEVFTKRGQLETVYNYAKRLKNCPMARVFLAGYIELAAQFRVSQAEQQEIASDAMLLEKIDSISRALERATAQEVTKLERWLIFLGTTGSVTPFIGLFGTVWGVMNAFSGIGSKGAASIAVVAPGIAEALVATAAGLFAAIPAVIAYNYFIYRVKFKATEMDNFSLDMLSLIDRVYIKRSA